MCLAPQVAGQTPEGDAPDQGPPKSERHEEALRWLDTYLSDAVLLRPEDIAKIREAVAQMTPSQLDQWLAQTEELRAYIVSPQWQRTRRWLSEFLRVQRIYSDEEIEKLRQEVFDADATEMLEIMQRIRAKHESMEWMQNVSERNRQLDLKARDARATRPAATGSSGRSSRSAPLFGSGSSLPSRPSSGYRPPQPLITSRDVARMTTWREVWGGMGW